MVSASFFTLLYATLVVVKFVRADTLESRASDPCAVIGGQKWAAPADVRACFESFAVDEDIKSNVSPQSLGKG